MTSTLAFLELEKGIAEPTTSPTGTRLRRSGSPNPFVAPPLQVRRTDSRSGPLGVEVIFLEAPAAVGKSTVADRISASRDVPILNLAKVRVSTGALAGIINADYPDPTAAQAAFHRGELPLIIDALEPAQPRPRCRRPRR